MRKKNITTLNLNEFLPYRLSVVANKVSRALANLYSERFNVTVHEWRVMAVLGQQPGLSADQVCAKTEMDKVSVSRAVTKLLKKKHIERNVYAKDRRRSNLKLSNNGHKVYDKIVPLALEFETRLVQSLAKNELEQLSVLLKRLNNSIADIGYE